MSWRIRFVVPAAHNPPASGGFIQCSLLGACTLPGSFDQFIVRAECNTFHRLHPLLISCTRYQCTRVVMRIVHDDIDDRNQSGYLQMLTAREGAYSKNFSTGLLSYGVGKSQGSIVNCTKRRLGGMLCAHSICGYKFNPLHKSHTL